MTISLIEKCWNSFGESSVEVRVLFFGLRLGLCICGMNWEAVSVIGFCCFVGWEVHLMVLGLGGGDAVWDLEVVVFNDKCAPYQVVVGIDKDGSSAEHADEVVQDEEHLLFVGAELVIFYFRVDGIDLWLLLLVKVQNDHVAHETITYWKFQITSWDGQDCILCSIQFLPWLL